MTKKKARSKNPKYINPDHYEAGQVLDLAKLTVLGPIGPLSSMDAYLVRLHCCGEEAMMPRAAIHKRVNRGRYAQRDGKHIPVCRKCKEEARKARNQRQRAEKERRLRELGDIEEPKPVKRRNCYLPWLKAMCVVNKRVTMRAMMRVNGVR